MPGVSPEQLSGRARQAAAAGQWAVVESCARTLVAAEAGNPEGWFLLGLAGRAAGRLPDAMDAFRRAMEKDPGRYDAAIELAWLCWSVLRHAEARELLELYQDRLANSPMYLFRAAETWGRLGLHARALPLYRKAFELQPEVEQFQAGLAACAVLCGEIPQARELFGQMLDRHPDHQRHHYELSRLGRAKDRRHVDQMLAVLKRTQLPAEKNIFIYYALGKELEDLEAWDESFHYYQAGGNAAASVAAAAGYTVEQDVKLIQRIISECDADWFSRWSGDQEKATGTSRPLFVTGLPRTGTTLLERILASHTQVESADESFFLEIAIRRASGVSGQQVTPETISAVAGVDPARIGRDYLASVAYRLEGKPCFVEKYPFNFLYLGLAAAAMPQGGLLHMRRNPMDACFAMYKQPYFRFAFTLDGLAQYYPAYDRLMKHWQDLLGERLIQLGYEDLVEQQELQTRRVLDALGLDFEPACLSFEKNTAASASASTVQVREKIHGRSVNRWSRYAKQLQPLRKSLVAAGIEVDPTAPRD